MLAGLKLLKKKKSYFEKTTLGATSALKISQNYKKKTEAEPLFEKAAGV